MQFRQVLLMCSALITLAYSFPTGTEQNDTIDFPQNESKVLDAKDNKPLMVVAEEKNPKSESVVVEFVYTSNGGNSVAESKGTDRDKYVVDSPLHKETNDQTRSENENEKKKLIQELNTEETAHKQTNEPKADSRYTTKEFQMKVASSLIPEEISPLSRKWPKYFYDVFNPIQPFPELEYEQQNQINGQKIQIGNADTYLPYYEKERKEPINVAGPQLSPLSIYEREFSVPIFD